MSGQYAAVYCWKDNSTAVISKQDLKKGKWSVGETVVVKWPVLLLPEDDDLAPPKFENFSMIILEIYSKLSYSYMLIY